MKHAIGAFFFVVVLTGLGLLIFRTDLLLPVAASAQAGPIDWLFSLHFKVIAFLFALIMGLMLYAIIFFRRKPGDTTDGAYFKENTKLEFAWTIIPLIVVLVFALIGTDVLAKTDRPDVKPLEVKVVAQQWSWRFVYPAQEAQLGNEQIALINNEITTNELVLPVDKQVLLRLTAVDVIHAFWVPQFRVKQDAVPGQENDLRITPNRIGDYTLMCAEICGKNHAEMEAPVKVLAQESFISWVKEQQAAIPTDPVERGKLWYGKYGCKACHSLDGSRVIGPTFQALYGRQVEFEDGGMTTADEAYLFESIRFPDKHIVKGYANIMPVNIAKDLTDEKVNDIIDFIKSLK